MGIIRKQTEIAGDKGQLMAAVIFDSGAAASLVRRDVALEVAATIFTSRRAQRFLLDDGESGFMTNQATMLDVTINGETLTWTFWLADKLSDQVIIGADFMQRYKIKLDPEREEIVFADRWHLNNWLI